MNTKVLVFLGAATLAIADNRPTYSYNQPESQPLRDDSTEAKYEFDWEVSDETYGANFGHQEVRDGDSTQGSHYVLLPDNRLQTVTYFIEGDSGFVADVNYEGEARYPDSVESRDYVPPRPSYSAPRPTYTAPESKESVEKPVYTPPRPSYGYPQ